MAPQQHIDRNSTLKRAAVGVIVSAFALTAITSGMAGARINTITYRCAVTISILGFIYFILSRTVMRAPREEVAVRGKDRGRKGKK